MKILILNVGSSSVKYSLFEDEKLIEKGIEERVVDYKKAIEKVLFSAGKIDCIGHRVVHGGSITKTAMIDDKILRKIKDCSAFAPLHNIPEIKCIEICRKVLPKTKQYVVFDTAFHRTMPDFVERYAIPEKYFKRGVKRYGFHGTSHKYVAEQASKILGKGLSDLKLITCHLGNGCSITAIKNGKSVDTSMGFTPLEGLIMGTRCGDIDAAVVLYLIECKKISPKRLGEILNKESGLLAISGKYKDMRDLVESKNKGDRKSELAIEMFVYRIKKYIGAYLAAMNGADAIIFTAGIGENSGFIRKNILDNFSYAGVKIDENKNKANKEIISANDSKIKVLVIKTNEELMMAKEILRLNGK